MNLTEHFSLAELTASATAQRLGIDNHPGLEIISHLTQLAVQLERVRHALGDNPLIISSGYRCPELNQAVGGARRSAHMEGWAVDFTCPGFGSPLQIVKALAATGLPFDTLIQEGRWVHISFRPGARRKVLTAHFNPAGGKPTYTAGA